MWAEVIVVINKMPEALLGFKKLLRLSTAPELGAHRAPEALALSQGFGVMGP
jgi:hypothetical protein